MDAALEAARQAAASLGLAGEALSRQNDGSTSGVYAVLDVVLIVAPPGCPPEQVAERVAVASVLAESGHFVQPLWPVPAQFSGRVVSAWHRVALGAMDWEAAGGAVRALHETPPERLAAVTRLPRLGGTDDIGSAIERLAASGRISSRAAAVLDGARRRLDRELAGIDQPLVVVHGDLHLPNLIPSRDRVVLCDTDEISLGAADYDLAVLADPARRSLPAEQESAFCSGYGRAALPPPDRCRSYARTAHLRRTVALLKKPALGAHDRFFAAARLGAWARMATHWDADLVPVVAQSRSRQLRLAALGVRL